MLSCLLSLCGRLQQGEGRGLPDWLWQLLITPSVGSKRKLQKVRVCKSANESRGSRQQWLYMNNKGFDKTLWWRHKSLCKAVFALSEWQVYILVSCSVQSCLADRLAGYFLTLILVQISWLCPSVCAASQSWLSKVASSCLCLFTQTLTDPIVLDHVFGWPTAKQ